MSESYRIPHRVMTNTKWNESFGVQAPDIFYKFTPVGPWLLELFQGNSLLFSSRTSFNDPFDCRPAFRLRSEKEAIGFFQSKLQILNISPARRLLKAKEGVRLVSADANVIADHLRRLLDNIGVLCLTAKWNHPLMWSHYANSHKGIAVGFHNNIDVFRLAHPVTYTEKPPVVLIPVDETPQLYFDVFQNKAECWRYEDEWRVVKPTLNALQRDEQYRELLCHTTVTEAKSLADQRGPGTYPFPKTAIASVTLGMHLPSEDEIAVMKWIQKAELNIPVYKVAPPSSQYLLERTRIA